MFFPFLYIILKKIKIFKIFNVPLFSVKSAFIAVTNVRHVSDQFRSKLRLSISDFQISGQSLIKENVHNSRANDDIDFEIGPLTKLDKRYKTTSIKLAMTPSGKNVTSGNRIPDT